MNSLLTITAAVGFALTSPTNAHTTVIDNGTPEDDGWAALSDFTVGRQRADDFVVSGNVELSRIYWFGSYRGNTVEEIDAFTIRLHASSSGIPAVTPFASLAISELLRESTGLQDSDGGEIFGYSCSIALQLEPGTYWLSIINQTTSSSGPGDLTGAWMWAPSDGSAGNAIFRGLDEQTWMPDSHGSRKYAFSLAVSDPQISISRESESETDELTISFSGVIQESSDLGDMDPWSDIDPQPTSPWTFTPTAGKMFYRIKR